MTTAIGASLGKLEGRGEVRGPDGTLKAIIVLSSDCSQEEAERAASALNVQLKDEEHGNGGNAPHGSP